MNSNTLYEQIEALDGKSQDLLLEVIGAYALSQEPSNLPASLATDGVLKVEDIKETANSFLESIKPVLREALCGSDGIMHYSEQATAKDIISIVLPALGFPTLGFVPTAMIAVCIIIARAGLREYCSDINSQP